MSLNQNLSQFRFDLETGDLLQSNGRSSTEVRNQLSLLGFSNSLLNLMLENRRLLNSVLLRLDLYSESNLSESSVRTNLGKLSNNQVNDLVNYLYDSSSSVVSVQSEDDNVENNVADNEEISETEDVNVEVNDEMVLLNNFFNECISVTEDATDVVRSSEFYNALTEWWSNENVEVPDKKVLKNYLNDRLGKANKSTWSKVTLN